MLFLTFMLCVASAVATVDYTGHRVLRATPRDKTHLDALNKLTSQYDFWKEPTTLNRAADVRVSPEDYETLRAHFDGLRVPHEILHENVQKLIDDSKTPRSHQPVEDFDDYKDFDAIQTYLQTAAAACGSRCAIEEIGQSFEGRPILAFKISTGAGKRGLFIDSGIHAREWLAFSTGLYFIDRFVYDFGVDADVDAILDTYDITIVPALNPDGYVYTWTDDRMWRKSRQTYSGESCVGADINRNFDFMWLTVGASDDPCSNTFAGPAPHSEPESVAVRDYVMAQNGNWDLYMTMHTYGQLWMAPFGYTTTLPPDYDELMRVANIGADALTAVHGTQYETGTASEILYQSSGTSRDWARGVPNIPYVYTLELRDERSFVLPPSEILPTAEETWAGLKAAVLAFP